MDATAMIVLLFLFAILCLLLCGICLVLFFRLRREVRAMDLRQNHLVEEFRDFQSRLLSDRRQNFSGVFSLENPGVDAWELKSRLKRATEQDTEVSGKYRHIADLERSGLGVAELAEILDVSADEAGQMMALSRVV